MEEGINVFCTAVEIHSKINNIKTLSIIKTKETCQESSLDPYTAFLRCRLDRDLSHLPIKCEGAESSCQMHYWTEKNSSKASYDMF